jgi:hypothetical protein
MLNHFFCFGPRSFSLSSTSTIQMPFQFTFSIPQVFTNPFSPQSHQIAPERPNVNEPTSDDTTRLAAPSSSENRSLTRHPTLSSHDLSVDPDNSRKRGWEPSYPVPSSLRATATPTTAGGYLDTPAKYRDQAMLDDPVRAPTDDSIMEAMLDGKDFQQIAFIVSLATYSSTSILATHFDTPPKFKSLWKAMSLILPPDLRPAKKRRTVTESIISTAYSAALIGTAVGFTVYRLYVILFTSNLQTQSDFILTAGEIEEEQRIMRTARTVKRKFLRSKRKHHHHHTSHSGTQVPQ